MHEDLLGYLLGALEPDEMQRVAQWLREDPEAREQLAELDRMIRPLEEGYVPVEGPPADLVARTLALLPSEPAPLVPMHAVVETPRSGSFSWLDWVGGAAAAAVVLGLLLPALARGRFESRKIACQDQLRRFGTALTQFVSRNPQERLPAVSESGPEAFAGVYAVRLKEYGLIEDPDLRWCPSLEVPSRGEATLTNLGEIASVDDLYSASADRLQQIQRYAGGHYAYNLGVVDQQRFSSPRFEARSTFAVMSDAPLTATFDGEAIAESIGHGGDGINVLYEDGRVRFVPIAALDQMQDHPLVNHRGRVEAGVNIEDASLAPSWRPPFIDVPQH